MDAEHRKFDSQADPAVLDLAAGLGGDLDARWAGVRPSGGRGASRPLVMTCAATRTARDPSS